MRCTACSTDDCSATVEQVAVTVYVTIEWLRSRRKGAPAHAFEVTDHHTIVAECGRERPYDGERDEWLKAPRTAPRCLRCIRRLRLDAKGG